MNSKFMIVLLCMIVLSNTQTTCTSAKLTRIQTGQIVLNPNDLGSAGANKNYYESLQRGQFKPTDFLGNAFAIAGFETSCSQTFYGLMVDVVEMLNENTNMRIVIDFKSPSSNDLTVWTKVKLTYLVVAASRFQAAPADTAFIWATNTQVDLTKNDGIFFDAQSVFSDTIFGLGDDNGCGLQFDTVAKGYKFGIKCDNTIATDAVLSNDVAIHSYVMGFKYLPTVNATTGTFLGVSIQWNNWMTGATGTQSQLAISSNSANRGGRDTSTGLINKYGVFINYDDISSPTFNGNGPIFNILTFNKQLIRIKIAIVLTVINPKFPNTPTQPDNAYGSTSSFSYSGLYQVVPKANYNIQNMIVKTNYNQLKENLPTKKYMIYGLSKFDLAQSSKCSSFNIDVSVDSPNSYTFTVNNVDSVSNVVFQADIYTPPLKSFCQPKNQAKIQFSQLSDDNQLANAIFGDYKNLRYLKSRQLQQYSTIPSNNINQNIVQNTDNPLNLKFTVLGLASDTTNVRLNAKVIMNDVINGKPYGIVFKFTPKAQVISPSASANFHDATDGSKYKVLLKVNGNTLFNKQYTGTQLNAIQTATNKFEQKFFGINLFGTNATFQYNLIIPRVSNAANKYEFSIDANLFQFQTVYDPVTECCVDKCAAQTGLDVSVTPVTCVVCDSTKGLVYDASKSSCKCKQGYYLSQSLQYQCFPCTAKLCSSCSADATSKCNVCVQGGILNQFTFSCSCNKGFYQVNNTCASCSHKCATCTTKLTCQTCSDVRRDINNNCSCIGGFYDAGVDKCQPCNSGCATCSNSSTCLTCDPAKNRTLKGSVCACNDKFYEIVYQNGTRQCKPCSVQCGTCSLSSTECLTCNTNFNRIQGYDSLGRRTCICKPGYYALSDGSCIQSDCKADKYCSQCQKDLSLCIQCRASLNRVIKLPEHVCVCDTGFYQDSNGDCKPCSSGCAKCTSATKCDSCVVSGTNNNDGTCRCAAGTLFTLTTNNVRYCKQCVPNCESCNNTLTCNNCRKGFILSTDNTCVCPKRNYINAVGQCVPCKSGCQLCSNATNCNKCVAPLVVQADTCVTKCSEGSFIQGSVCTTCSNNCVGCISSKDCYYCKDGFYLHEGSCYQVCPAGTLANKANARCIACNVPCKTCTNHPSTCTSCQPGVGFLQITGLQQTCVRQCADGTYPKNNVCEVCDFKCLRCLGSASNCVACPVGRFLYNGACWDYCPGVLINNTCVNACPSGFYRFTDQQCKPCNSTCNTCENALTCSTCKNGLVSKDGQCIQSCGNGFYLFRGLCVACDKSCRSCLNNPTQCIDCAQGYIKLASSCVAACPDGTFLDTVTGICKQCSSECRTCTSQKFCSTCQNNQITPVAGQCSSCLYPCETCSQDLSTCHSCLSGFFLSNGQCSRTCPSGSRPVNGVCVCSSGLFFNGGCVSVCPSGYTKVGTECRRCQAPCTQCSGKQNFCTDCLDSYTLKPNSGVCVQNSLCNFGQQQLNGKCQRICDQGSYYQNGACIFGGCPQGFKDNGFGGCIQSSTQINRCDSPTFRLNGICVDNCGNGFFPNTNTRTCDTCSINCLNCLNRNYCLTCSSAFTVFEGRCISKSNCLSNQFSYNNLCVSTCPLGTFTSNGRCIRSCPLGTFYFGNVCYNTCPTEACNYTENSCVATCPAGTKLIDKVCQLVL